MLVSVLGSVTSAVAMSNNVALWLAVEPAHLPHYGHTAGIVGSVIIRSLIAPMAGASFLWSRRG